MKTCKEQSLTGSLLRLKLTCIAVRGKQEKGGGKKERLTLAVNEKHQAFMFANMNGFLKGHKSGSNTSAPLHTLIYS